MTQPVQQIKDPPRDPLAQVKQMVRACIQCGTCTGSCPNEFAMDHTPRHLWRLVLTGQPDEIFKSKTFILCSSCYACTLRCPPGPAPDRSHGRSQADGLREHQAPYQKSIRFYKSFLNSVRRYGRVREMEFMSLYFLSMKNPLLPFSYAPLGLKLMAKGKVSLELPGTGKKVLDSLFRKVEELEA